MSTLNASSLDARLQDLSTFEVSHQDELEAKELELKNLNKTLLETQIQKHTAQLSELTNVILRIRKVEQQLSIANWQELLNLTRKILELEGKAKSGIKDLALRRGIDFYESKEFKDFLDAAEAYIKLLGKENYPSDDDVCIYCRQDIASEESRLLLKNYRQLLNDKTQELLTNYKEDRAQIKSDIALLDSNIIFHQDTFGVDEQQNAVQPNNIIIYNRNLTKLKLIVEQDIVDEKTVINIDFNQIFENLIIVSEELQEKLLIAKDALDNLQTRERVLNNQIAELKNRKLLNSKVAEVTSAIIDLRIIDRLNRNKNKFSTNLISRKTTEDREELVKHNFIEIFNKELALLRRSRIKVDINFGTVKGSSRVQQKIKSAYGLPEILSEGEQKAIALAEYLTELQLDQSNSPVIFDDPVNSLDHHVIEDVSKRLLLLSQERQVIICTHSLILFNSLMHHSKQAPFTTLEKKFYNTRNEFGINGFIIDAEDEINSIGETIIAINKLIRSIDKTRKERDIAAEGYGHLRSGIELCVENKIFKKTVTRYKKNIMLGEFINVNGELLDRHKYELNDIYERCCAYIYAHSNPSEMGSQPTLEEFIADFDKFKVINSNF